MRKVVQDHDVPRHANGLEASLDAPERPQSFRELLRIEAGEAAGSDSGQRVAHVVKAKQR